jgi:hypothetical protein
MKSLTELYAWDFHDGNLKLIREEKNCSEKRSWLGRRAHSIVRSTPLGFVVHEVLEKYCGIARRALCPLQPTPAPLLRRQLIAERQQMVAVVLRHGYPLV